MKNENNEKEEKMVNHPILSILPYWFKKNLINAFLQKSPAPKMEKKKEKGEERRDEEGRIEREKRRKEEEVSNDRNGKLLFIKSNSGMRDHGKVTVTPSLE